MKDIISMSAARQFKEVELYVFSSADQQKCSGYSVTGKYSILWNLAAEIS